MPTSCLNSVKICVGNVTFQEYIKNRSYICGIPSIFSDFSRVSVQKNPKFSHHLGLTLDSPNGKTPFARFTLLEAWRMTAQQLWHCYVVQNYRTSSDVVVGVGVVTGVFVETGFARTCSSCKRCVMKGENYPSFPKHRKHVDIDTLRLGIVGMFSKAKILR